ncbi:putative CALMODULIN-BINDING PROTEIN60 [Lupinus albus]|uniref:Putative CALMODULIN-BINDING PROTEIN60 n=1 Tax=Lupinus albus TaxID=3870 RepID=A0A6A4QNH9_LUPAL|nr:putative CALMODULIN-BINDING PROTEIN60 [Lupinus albus]
MQNVRSLLQMKPEIEQKLTHLVRRIVQEELERGILLRPIINKTEESFKLVFKNEVPTIFFTHSKIKAKDEKPIEIALYDTISKSIVTEGPLSSIKIEICVLNGEFGSNGSEDWSTNEFNAKILTQRNDKAHLLKGDRVITLKNGVGIINNILFTDNSSWTRSRCFRLGAKVSETTLIQANIKEGRSKPFTVKHDRSEARKKNQCPSLNDEVWCLKMIKRNGKIHQQLCSIEIKTVKDLLQLYTTNQVSLQKIIGKKSWGSIIKQAKACDMDNDKRYIYHFSAPEQSISLLFNCIYEVLEVSFNGQNYCSLQSLNLKDQLLVERVKQQAYTNVKDNLIPLDPTTHALFENLPVQHIAVDQLLDQGQPETLPNLCEQATPTSNIGEADAYNYEHHGTEQLPEFGEMSFNCEDYKLVFSS